MKAVSAQVVSCCVYDKPKKYATQARQHSILVWLLGWSSCSSPSSKELHGPANQLPSTLTAIWMLDWRISLATWWYIVKSLPSCTSIGSSYLPIKIRTFFTCLWVKQVVLPQETRSHNWLGTYRPIPSILRGHALSNLCVGNSKNETSTDLKQSFK